MEYRINDMRFIEEERQKTIKVEGETFIIKALFPKDYRDIARKVAIEQNGLAANTFSMDDRYRFQRDVTVDHAIVKSPDWWTNSNACPYETILDSLYGEIQDWTAEFQEMLKKNRFKRGGGESKIPS